MIQHLWVRFFEILSQWLKCLPVCMVWWSYFSISNTLWCWIIWMYSSKQFFTFFLHLGKFFFATISTLISVMHFYNSISFSSTCGINYCSFWTISFLASSLNHIRCGQLVVQSLQMTPCQISCSRCSSSPLPFSEQMLLVHFSTV